MVRWNRILSFAVDRSGKQVGFAWGLREEHCGEERVG